MLSSDSESAPPAATGPEPFGKYLLDREIARGGMARVHLARLRGLGGFEKRLVVKQILPQLARDPRFVSMFVEEAKTLVQMSHPHIVPVYELGVVDGVYFLAMEYVEGATLADLLEEGALDAAQAAHVAAQVCDALSYAHERFAIVHRDVTPRNVIVDAAGHCRLLDFGIAAPAEDDAEGVLFGTPGYLSPEQARGESIGPASDLFAVGAVLLHALSGEPPFDAKDVDATRALTRQSTPIESSARGVDATLAPIVDRALAYDPAERWESARALGRALRGWLASRRPEGVAPELGARAERARTRRERRRASERPSPPGDGGAPGADADGQGTPSVGREPRRDERTLAQSRALEEIIDGTAPLARASAPPRAETPEGTLPIAERGAAGDAAAIEGGADARDARGGTSAREDAPHGGTVPLPGRSGRHPAVREPERATRRRSSTSGPIVVGVLTVVAVIVLVIAAGEGATTGSGSGAGAGTGSGTGSGSGAGSGAGAATGSGGGAAVGADAGTVPGTGIRADAGAAGDAGAQLAEDAGAGDAGRPGRGDASSARADASAEGTSRARSATLDVTSTDWAFIRLDGRSLGRTPVRAASVAPGAHTLVAENPGYEPARRSFRVEAGQRIRVMFDFRGSTTRIEME